MENSELRPSNARHGPGGQIVAFEGTLWSGACRLKAGLETRRDLAKAPGAQPSRLRKAVLKALAES